MKLTAIESEIIILDDLLTCTNHLHSSLDNNEVIRSKWHSSITTNGYLSKGDVIERRKYRGIKLFHQVLKLVRIMAFPSSQEGN